MAITAWHATCSSGRTTIVWACVARCTPLLFYEDECAKVKGSLGDLGPYLLTAAVGARRFLVTRRVGSIV